MATTKAFRILFAAILLLACLTGCVLGGGDPQGPDPEDVTATFGAHVFGTQQAEIAIYETAVATFQP